jgi:hypothetical protein
MLADRYADSPPPAVEWNFADLCPQQEQAICHDWEMWRELVLNDRAPSLLDWILSLRQKYRRRTFTQTAKALRSSDELGRAEWHWLMLVGCHQWPAQPYLSIDPDWRIERLKHLLPELFLPLPTYLAMDTLPYRLSPGWVKQLRDLQPTGKVPKLRIATLSLLDYDAKLRTGSSGLPRGHKYLLVPFLIDPAWMEKEFISRARVLWYAVVQPSKKRRTSGTTGILKLLNQLGAYRLINDFQMSYEEAIEFSADNRETGRPLYQTAITFRRAVNEYTKCLCVYAANSH